MLSTERDLKNAVDICLAQSDVAKKGGQTLESVQKCHSLPETIGEIPWRNTDAQSAAAQILPRGR